MSRSSNRKTIDFEGMKYSPELIRQLENPDYAKKADEYERRARRAKHSRSNSKAEHSFETENSYVEDLVVGDIKGKRSKKNSKKKNGKNKSYKFKPKKLIRNIIFILLLIFIVFTAVFFLMTRNFDKVNTKNSDFAIDSQVAKELRGYRNIAILGVDARADEGYDGSRTDAIIIMSIKKTTGDVKLISVMRDSYLKMGYFDDSLILDKITHAHHYAGGVNTCAALNRSLDLNIDEFVIFNWKSVADMVDTLGGVTIEVKKNEISDMNKWGPETAENVGTSYKKITSTGLQNLDGAQAVTYCRIRKNSGGDSGRAQRYKKVVSAVMKKAITRPWKISAMTNKVFPQIRTNMNQLELYTLCLGFPRYDFGNSVGFPKTYYSGLLSDGISYVVPTTLEKNVKRLHKDAFNQDNYQLSNMASEINQDIINDTGIQ